MIPFCDFASLTAPWDCRDDLLRALDPVLDAAGVHVDTEKPDYRLYRLVGSSGTVIAQRLHSVLCVSASGGVLTRLRETNTLGDYLMGFVSVPYRIGYCDLTLDLPTPAPAFVRDIIERARAGLIQPGRKKVSPTDVKTYLSLDAWGNETGTVYIGAPRINVRPKVYDKRWQLYERLGLDPGPLTRIEIRARGRIGVCLRDLHSPAPLFYHLASPDLIAAPPDVQSWSPQDSGGFTLPPRADLTPLQLIDRKLDSSPDIARIVDLALSAGPHGVDWLCTRIRAIALQRVVTGPGDRLGAVAAMPVAGPEAAPAAVRPPVH